MQALVRVAARSGHNRLPLATPGKLRFIAKIGSHRTVPLLLVAFALIAAIPAAFTVDGLIKGEVQAKGSFPPDFALTRTDPLQPLSLPPVMLASLS